MKPYTYLIRWTKLNISYYGVRYAQDCDPSDLWNPYKTSSTHVAEFIAEHGEPDVVRVRKTFIEVPVAQNWEHRVLKRIKAVSSDRWLNRTDNKSIAPQYGEDHPHYGKKGQAHHSYGKSNAGASKAQKQKWANFVGQHPWSDPEFIARNVASKSGDRHHMKQPEIVEKVSGKNNWIYQKPGALEERQKQFIEMNKARKGTHYRRVCCKHCGKDYASVQIKQHIRRCEMNLTSLVANTDSRVYNQL
jgi:hypothetical protein